MPAAQALNTAVATRADEHKPSVSRGWSKSLSQHKNKGGVEHHWCDPAASEAAFHGWASFNLLLLVISNSSTWRELYCAGDRGTLEDCTREVCIWGVFKTHYPNLRVTTFQDIIVSWTLINSFTNHNLLCIKPLLQRLSQHYFLLKIQTAGKNKWIYHHLCLAMTSYSHMGFMLRKLRYGNIKWQQETCKPCRKNNSEHLNHEVSMMLLEEKTAEMQARAKGNSS